MTINQLFKKHPDFEYIQPILKCYNIEDINNTKSFTKTDLKSFNTVEKLLEQMNLLEELYLPCKAKIYLKNLTEKKCITILRQLLKLFKLNLNSSEHYFHGEKMIQYNIYNNDTHNIDFKDKCVISFD